MKYKFLILHIAATFFVLLVGVVLVVNGSISLQNLISSNGGPSLVSLLSNSDKWRFIVSGDSRNCGDVVMPAIATQSSRYAPSFYWHLGDLRAIYKTDEDMEAAAARNGQILTCGEYYRRAWPDFIDNQIAPFGSTPFFLGISNHEAIPPKDENQFVSQFSAWLASPVLNQQRREDNERDPDLPRAYYHWIQRGVDFIYLDNSSDSFSKEQLDWFDRIAKRAQNDSNILSLVVGMHEALPDSIASGHAMCDKPEKVDGCTSGRHVYNALVEIQRSKPVYTLASHSHFYMNGAFDNQPSEQRLAGWIVGTAGAVRYKLPDTAPSDSATDVYGYLLGTVERNGKINFEFKQVKEVDVPDAASLRYPSWLVPWCFAHNSQNVDPNTEETTHRCVFQVSQSDH